MTVTEFQNKPDFRRYSVVTVEQFLTRLIKKQLLVFQVSLLIE